MRRLPLRLCLWKLTKMAAFQANKGSKRYLNVNVWQRDNCTASSAVGAAEHCAFHLVCLCIPPHSAQSSDAAAAGGWLCVYQLPCETGEASCGIIMESPSASRRLRERFILTRTKVCLSFETLPKSTNPLLQSPHFSSGSISLKSYSILHVTAQGAEIIHEGNGGRNDLEALPGSTEQNRACS